MTSRAQTATLSAGAASYGAAAGNVTFTVTINYATLGTPTALGFSVNIPAGWTYVSAAGPNAPEIRPSVGSTATLEFAFTSPPTNQTTFAFTVGYPANLTGDQLFSNPLAIVRVNGSQTSFSAASVTITGSTTSAPVAPTLTSQPVSQSIVEGQRASFSVGATGTPTPTYQWRKGGVSIAGQTGASLVIASASTTDAGAYSVVVTNSAGSVISNAATLTVNSLPKISSQPIGLTVNAGQSATFTVVASGSPAPIYQWRKGGVSVAGATGSTLTLSAVTTANAGVYDVAISNLVGTVISNTATLVVNSGGTSATAPAIVTPPAGRSAEVGTAVTLTVVATGTAPLTYQWRKDGVLLAGATNSSLIVAGAAADSGSYTVTVGNAVGTVTSPAAAVQFTAAPVANAAPVITVQPTFQVVLAGAAATFTVVATGSPAPTYQWRKNGVDLLGATMATFTIPAAQAADVGGYEVSVTNAIGHVVSSLAHLAVTATAVSPVITRQPAGLVAVSGRPAALSVGASGAPTPTYVWRKDGVVVAGASGPVLSFANLTTAEAGSYTVILANSAGSETSVPAVLTVLARSYAGCWFGALFGGGSFALQMNADNTGVFLAFAPGSHTAYVSRGVGVDTAGRVRFVATTTSGGPATAAAPRLDLSAPISAPAVGELAFEGTIGDDGTLTGSSTAGTGVSFSAARAVETGATAAAAGFYQAAAGGSTAQILAIVSQSGGAFVLTQAGGVLDAGTGTVDATGKLTVTTAAQQIVTATVSAQVLTAAVSDQKGVSTTFAGAAENSAARASQRLVNISARTTAGTGDQVAIVGFVITGLESKTVLLRAIGPALAGFGVTTALAAPRLDLYRSSTLIGTNTRWSTAGNVDEVVAAATRSGAFALETGSADSILLTTLAPGTYSAVVTASDGRPGVGLVEVYDLSGASLDQRLANISTRAVVGAGDATLIAGLVVGGAAPKRVLVRAAGPVLAAFGIGKALARPQLTLYSGTSVIAQNAGWSAASDPAAIATAASEVGAFAFSAESLDAALILNLAPGSYTAQVTGLAGSTGIALVEVYELP